MSVTRILCYGDSLTWGWVGVEQAVPTTRYPAEERWPNIMLKELGDGFEVVEEGLSGRTTSVADPVDPRLDGSAYLPSCLASHLPLDIVVLMLGTNDMKKYFARSAFDIATGMSKLLGIVQASAGGVGTAYPAPRCLIVAPPPISEPPDPWFASLFEGAQQTSVELAKHYEDLARFAKVDYLNAANVLKTGGKDGIHFSLENNKALASAVAAKIRSMLV